VTPRGGARRDAPASRSDRRLERAAPRARDAQAAASPTHEGATPGSDAPGRVLWIALAVLVALRGCLAFVPAMAGWGANILRFVPAWIGGLLWLASALPLVPALGRRLDAAARRREPARPGVPGAGAFVIAALAAAALVLVLPDRSWYVGDFMLRQGAVAEMLRDETVFRQAMPLDQVLHYQGPRWALEQGWLDANASARVIGMIDVAGLAVAAVALARVLGLGGVTAWCVAAIAFFGGGLVLFTGYGKAVVELGVLTAAVTVAGLHVVRSGGGVLGFGVLLALALPLHRSAVALLPVALVVWASWARDPRARGRRARPATWLGFALPLGALALVAPRIVRTMVDVDLDVHLQPHAVRAGGGVLRAAFAGTRPLDFVNVAVALAPLVPLALVLPLALRAPRDGRGREAAVLLAVALPLIAAMIVIHPVQGLFRDWDNFVSMGIALTFLTAWLVAEALRAAPRWAWLAIPAALGAVAPTLQWMIHHRLTDRGMARFQAVLGEPPRRSDTERVAALDYLGIRHMHRGEFAASARAFERAVELAPSARFYFQWALAETEAANYAGAMEVYRRMLERHPQEQMAWRGYTAMATRTRRWDEARRGANELLKLVPGDPEALRLLRGLAREDSLGRR
jgi:tetratricopeptide (TPR) repeat protein